MKRDVLELQRRMDAASVALMSAMYRNDAYAIRRARVLLDDAHKAMTEAHAGCAVCASLDKLDADVRSLERAVDEAGL